jgi:hypothetical protein
MPRIWAARVAGGQSAAEPTRCALKRRAACPPALRRLPAPPLVAGRRLAMSRPDAPCRPAACSSSRPWPANRACRLRKSAASAQSAAGALAGSARAASIAHLGWHSPPACLCAASSPKRGALAALPARWLPAGQGVWVCKELGFLPSVSSLPGAACAAAAAVGCRAQFDSRQTVAAHVLLECSCS